MKRSVEFCKNYVFLPSRKTAAEDSGTKTSFCPGYFIFPFNSLELCILQAIVGYFALLSQVKRCIG